MNKRGGKRRGYSKRKLRALLEVASVTKAFRVVWHLVALRQGRVLGVGGQATKGALGDV